MLVHVVLSCRTLRCTSAFFVRLWAGQQVTAFVVACRIMESGRCCMLTACVPSHRHNCRHQMPDAVQACSNLHLRHVMACRVGKVTVTHLATGDYEVQDVRCCKCSTSLGWTYLKAFNEVLAFAFLHSNKQSKVALAAHAKLHHWEHSGSSSAL